MLAKNDQSYILHCEIVWEVTKILFKSINVTVGEQRDYFLHILEVAAKLHDIGKLTQKFQNMLKDNGDISGQNHRHNQVGWAFLEKFIKDDYTGKSHILNIVHWHHGVNTNSNSKGCGKIKALIIDNDEYSGDIKPMLDALKKVVGQDNIKVYDDMDDDIIDMDSYIDSEPPLFYLSNKTESQKLQYLRSLVITADRIGSGFNSLSEISHKSVEKSYFDMQKKISFNVGDMAYTYDDRFKVQEGISNHIDNTIILNAPAGFGKTLTGLMWSIKSGRKLLWVVPRNTIAISVYKSILEEITNLNTDHIPSVQLLLSGEVKDSNTDVPIYESDIIVTNIDNFLAPTFKTKHYDLSSLILGSDVVFDEYHEFITESAIMAAFIDIVTIRKNFTNSKTMMLSATPILLELRISNLFGSKNKVVILPNNGKHYSPVHSKPYNLEVSDKPPSIIPNTNSLVIKNSIRNAQDIKKYNSKDYKLLLHSLFLDDKKNQDLNFLLKAYGKVSKPTLVKDNVIGTPMLQASLDVSFDKLYEDCMSPQSTVQRFGRVNRWGEFNTPSVYIYKPVDNTNKSNEGAINTQYDISLYKKWYDTISKYNKQSITLSKLYEIYNAFMIKNSSDINNYHTKLLSKSYKNLSNIYPKEYFKNVNNGNIKVAGSNPLRSSGSEVFFIVKHHDNDQWVGPFTHQLRTDFGVEFKEDEYTASRIRKTINNLDNDSRFDYKARIKNKRALKNLNLDTIRSLARFSDTPYIRYDKVYHLEFGIIDS